MLGEAGKKLIFIKAQNEQCYYYDIIF